MAFDSSRFTFNAWNDFLGVVMQQGRVQTDADWNEWLTEFARRIQAGTMDTIGRAVYPATTPNAFRIQLDPTGQHLTIGAGRMYVDGLMVENHGPLPGTWDPALAELSGAPAAPPAATEIDLDYMAQPYLPQLPNAIFPPAGGPVFLAYLDVWKRAVTYLEYPDLIDKAIGVDTTGRIQMVWQVKLLPLGNDSTITCTSSISAWDTLIAPSASRLSTAVVQNANSGPCCLSPATGYTGQENQLYRVEIHQKGTANASGTASPVSATFKWSRDNASVITGVTAIDAAKSAALNPASKLTVMSTGRDDTLSFQPGNWIEITDDYLELNGMPGELHRIDTNGVSKALKTITLQDPVSTASGLATRLTSAIDYHTRICRWDQGGMDGKVYQTDGVNLTEWVDLDAVNGTGDIPVPPPGTSLVLENGVTVTFNPNPAGGNFATGDCWTFAARTADGSVEILNDAPPMGIHHHYARLSIVNYPTNASDCRTPWPPPTTTAEGDCACTVCVDAADHNAGTFTIAQAVQQIISLGGGRICLGPGIFQLGSTTLQLEGLEAVEIVGQGPATVLAFAGTGPAILAQGNIGLRIQDLTVLALGSAAPAEEGSNSSVAVGILLRNSIETVIEDCAVFAIAVAAPPVPPPPPPPPPVPAPASTAQAFQVASVTPSITTMAVALDGFLVETQIRDNLLCADIGIGQASQLSAEQSSWVDESRDVLMLANLDVTDNFLPCAQGGVGLVGLGAGSAEQLNVYLLEIAFRENRVLGCAVVGIAIAGFTMPDAAIRIADNHIDVPGIGILCGADGAEIADNLVTQAMTAASGNSAGGFAAWISGILIVSAPGGALAITVVRILRNRISSYTGPGISVTGKVLLSSIVGNSIVLVTNTGISVTGPTVASEVMIRDNEIFNVIAPVAPPPVQSLMVGPQAAAANLGQEAALSVVVPAAETSETVVTGIQVATSTTATIENNSVALIGNSTGIRAIGIGVATGAAANIAGNDVSDIGPAGPGSTAFGIYSINVAAVNVSNNVVRQTTTSGVTTRLLFGGIVVEDSADIEKTGAEAVVNGNMVYGNSLGLMKIVSEQCVLTGNLCKQGAKFDAPRTDAIVIVEAETCIASNNRIMSALVEFTGLSISGPGGPKTTAQATVLGNIVTFEILLNGAPLGAPWQPLNLLHA